MAFELTGEQEQFFRTVLLSINHERKSAMIYIMGSGNPRTARELAQKFADDCSAPSLLTPKNIRGIFDNSLSPLELAVSEDVQTFAGRGEARGFKLTEKGEEVKPYAGFALEFMANILEQSIYPILGGSQSNYDKTRPGEVVNFLYSLADKPMIMRDVVISGDTAYKESHLTGVIQKLFYLKDAKSRPIPLVKLEGPSTGAEPNYYQLKEGAMMPASTKETKRWKALVNTFFSNPERIFSRRELEEMCGYDGRLVLNNRLSTLEEKGVITGYAPNEIRIISLTEHGRRFLHSLIDPIRGAIAGDPVSIGIIGRNQPNPADVARVLGYYADIRTLQMAGQPVIYQMQMAGQQK